MSKVNTEFHRSEQVDLSFVACLSAIHSNPFDAMADLTEDRSVTYTVTESTNRYQSFANWWSGDKSLGQKVEFLRQNQFKLQALSAKNALAIAKVLTYVLNHYANRLDEKSPLKKALYDFIHSSSDDKTMSSANEYAMIASRIYILLFDRNFAMVINAEANQARFDKNLRSLNKGIASLSGAPNKALGWFGVSMLATGVGLFGFSLKVLISASIAALAASASWVVGVSIGMTLGVVLLPIAIVTMLCGFDAGKFYPVAQAVSSACSQEILKVENETLIQIAEESKAHLQRPNNGTSSYEMVTRNIDDWVNYARTPSQPAQGELPPPPYSQQGQYDASGPSYFGQFGVFPQQSSYRSYPPVYPSAPPLDNQEGYTSSFGYGRQ